MQWSDNERKKKLLQETKGLWNASHSLSSENSRHFSTLPLVFPRNDVWKTSAEIPCWWRVTGQIWVAFLIGRAAREICFNQSETLPRSGWWRAISMEFVRLILRRLFTEKPVVASPNVSCFLRLVLFTTPKIAHVWWKLDYGQTYITSFKWPLTINLWRWI